MADVSIFWGSSEFSPSEPLVLVSMASSLSIPVTSSTTSSVSSSTASTTSSTTLSTVLLVNVSITSSVTVVLMTDVSAVTVSLAGGIWARVGEPVSSSLTVGAGEIDMVGKEVDMVGAGEIDMVGAWEIDMVVAADGSFD
eukprot:CAMPEP_0194297072 /NCGR_PEP_ID=MMETSP0169-20130528/57872_1 /TAXON_ID=218684 /ORGANISM="Corethron pennatum, Strain L29A3" /LENGTH=139 /DNA_ID=CAMNT_0039046755 /DNA_START=134 /DNA_END=553 /DNA_ORIENTATION=+